MRKLVVVFVFVLFAIPTTASAQDIHGALGAPLGTQIVQLQYGDVTYYAFDAGGFWSCGQKDTNGAITKAECPQSVIDAAAEYMRNNGIQTVPQAQPAVQQQAQPAVQQQARAQNSPPVEIYNYNQPIYEMPQFNPQDTDFKWWAMAQTAHENRVADEARWFFMSQMNNNQPKTCTNGFFTTTCQ